MEGIVECEYDSDRNYLIISFTLLPRINYHHLRYFWTVAREGSMARAAGLLHLTQPTISTQIAQFKAAVGQAVCRRYGVKQFGVAVRRPRAL